MVSPGSNQIELDGLDEARADFEGIDRNRLRSCHGRGVPYTEREARSPAPWFQATDMFCDAERIVGLISAQSPELQPPGPNLELKRALPPTGSIPVFGA